MASTQKDLPQVIPVFPLTGALILPRGQLPLHIFEPRYLAMVDDALRYNRIIGMVQPMDSKDNTPALYPIGCAGRLTSWSETGDGRYMIALSGLTRFRILQELETTTPYRQIRVDYAPFAFDLTPMDDESVVDRKRLAASIKAFFKQREMENFWPSMEHFPGELLINSLSMICPFPPAEKQALLEAPTLAERAHLLTALIEMTTAARGGPAGALQ
ncbi:MAG: LON peptidase substrate-binding domain-containing protein [Micropepsaceae bacterium]